MPRNVRTRSGTARRERIWSRAPILLDNIVAGAPQQQDLLRDLFGSLESTRALQAGVTVGPVILSGLIVRRESATVAINQDVVLGVRIGSVDIEAVDHEPPIRPMLDWMLFGAISAPDTTLTTAAVFQDFRTDSMRRFDSFQDRLWVVAGTAAAGAARFQLTGWASVLVILP